MIQILCDICSNPVDPIAIGIGSEHARGFV